MTVYPIAIFYIKFVSTIYMDFLNFYHFIVSPVSVTSHIKCFFEYDNVVSQ